VVWGRDAADLHSEIVFCHAATRYQPWPPSEQLRRQYSHGGQAPPVKRFSGEPKDGPDGLRFKHCAGVLCSIQQAVENLFETGAGARKRTATWRRGVELCHHIEQLQQPALEMADMMVTVGLQLRKPRDGHEQWEDWVTEWRTYCLGATSDAQRTFAIYALRERALLLGLPPPPGNSMRSLPLTKPTPRPRAEAHVVPLTVSCQGALAHYFAP